jgi:hypothetical protein
MAASTGVADTTRNLERHEHFVTRDYAPNGTTDLDHTRHELVADSDGWRRADATRDD